LIIKQNFEERFKEAEIKEKTRGGSQEAEEV
jgi:hypothetical protein